MFKERVSEFNFYLFSRDSNTIRNYALALNYLSKIDPLLDEPSLPNDWLKYH